MSTKDKSAEKLARRVLSGRASHVATKEIFSGLDWKATGSKPRRVSHSVYELLKHMSFMRREAGLLKGVPPADATGTRL